jgi:hypothetical protein
MNNADVITVRSNLYLWLLTGRHNDFFNAALNTGIEYSVGDTPAEVRRLRKLLKLDHTETDFFVLAALAAAKMSTAFVRTLPHENDAVFARGILTLPTIEVSCELLKANDYAWPSISGEIAGSEGFTSVVIEKINDDLARITTDTGKTETVGFSVAANDDGSYRLRVDKSADYGIRAQFLMPSWDVADTITIRFAPTQYPFRKMADIIRADGDARKVMSTEGTLQAFSEVSNSATRVGMLSLAIIRRMLRHINENQSGFSITQSQELASSGVSARTYLIDQVFTADLADAVVDKKEPVGFDV